MAFSNNLRYLRKKFNMSQEDLANKLGYKSFTTIQKWESGVSEPSVSIVKQIAQIFGVSMDAITNDNLSDDDVQEVNTIAAHHDDYNWTEEELKEIEDFKKYVLSKRTNK